ncbi:mannose-1-phosphate guanylyltransferase [Hyphomicrobium nitrativorans NL23]|uniref:mannose-1-phosphate guanylyltransferase n=1 Tax=Hyphomicrobium nitrativorans NL23 TaxID=1029756 RepID=V5SCS4_9HYPH|nr:mannose-1-phosphate guanylyltransferase/mannose-6-phosphate isomerase [Hyphomicrobium nitrativorans]AHB47830.1 mannose-1-phosphate guanylyltransferase [Hyphomicrobium nitrativorans NL23]
MNANISSRVEIVPVILSGGSGTRLWPLSRAQYPKQFVHGLNGQPAALLSATLARVAAEDFSAPLVVCNNAHRFLVREQAAEAGATLDEVVLEPSARNTAPAIAVAALMTAARNPAAVLVVLPSDHLIEDTNAFRHAVRRAANIAKTGSLVLFGIEPTGPHTGYGYIKKGKAADKDRSDAFEVEAFVEKPDPATAERYMDDGGYLWNSGIFVFKAESFLAELARHEPAVLDAARQALGKASRDLGFLRLDAEAFAKAPNISVDYAVMERTDKAVVLPLATSWSDLGSWASLWDAAPRDENGNFVHGDAFVEDTTDCYIRSEKALVSTIGVKDLVIVETQDALLIADKSRSQEVATIVAKLKASGRKEHEHHVRNHRPWGFFETLNIGPRFQVKLLHVVPGGILSLQMHHHRSEHWVVVKGTARVTVDGHEKLVRENESVYIVATQWHRLENPGKVPLELIEVQIGTYLGEDDIIRSEDIYNRSPDETR